MKGKKRQDEGERDRVGFRLGTSARDRFLGREIERLREEGVSISDLLKRLLYSYLIGELKETPRMDATRAVIEEYSNKHYLTTKEAAELVGVTKETITKWCRKGFLNCVRVGRQWRIGPENIEGLLKVWRTMPPQPALDRANEEFLRPMIESGEIPDPKTWVDDHKHDAWWAPGWRGEKEEPD